MHTLGELFVPFHMEQIYARRAAVHGNDDLLVVRAIRNTGHCGFTLTEQIQGFADMVTWVETGVRPGGDDVLDPADVADPDFGCAFTSVGRPGLVACPYLIAALRRQARGSRPSVPGIDASPVAFVFCAEHPT